MEIADARFSSDYRGTASPHPFALPFITLLATFTISTPAATILSIPRPLVLSALATVYLLFAIKWRIQSVFWQFALAFLMAFVPGTLYNINSPNIKATSVAQFLVLLVTFCALGTYFNEWLTLTPDRIKVKWIHIIFLYIFVVCLIEMCLPSLSASIRAHLYHSANSAANSIQDSMVQRESSIYGWRPMAFFSEPSNLAKYISVIVAAYMVITRCSWRSLFALVFFFVLIRSVSYFYALPIMAVALLRTLFPRDMFRRSGTGISGKLFVVLGTGILLIAAVLYTQSSRISAGVHGQDGSLQSRIRLPLRFLYTHPTDVIAGLGMTPQSQVESYTLMMKAMTSNTGYAAGITEAVSSTIVLIAGTGLAGMCIFFSLMFFFQKAGGVWLVIVFLVSNFINSGYNAPPTIIPTALLLALAVYQLRLAREERMSRLAESSLVVAVA